MPHIGSTPTRLSSAGLRITRQRVAVLESISSGEHLDVDTIADRARAGLGTISTQAVYDVLRVLGSADLVRRIEPAGKPALYEIRVGDNHHHLVCRQCGAVADTDCVIGAASCLEPSDDHGFVLDEAEVVFWGTCPQCQPPSTTARTEEAAV